MTLRVICDCDNTMPLPGMPIDDGQTLLYLLGRPDIELVGITTSFGNGTLDQVWEATTRLLRGLGRDDIPLLRGASRRGEGATEAARFLADQAAAAPGQISLLVLGPHGNPRAAAELDPQFYANLRQLACMGGYLRPLPGPSWGAVQELNLSADPEGALRSLTAPCPVALMSAQVCLDAPFHHAELAPLSGGDPALYAQQADFVARGEARGRVPADYLWDLLPAVYLSHPELFSAERPWLHSTLADLETGRLVLGEPGAGAQIALPERIVDRERFYALLYEAWGRVRTVAPL
jgi:purine nucleosidase